jgi:hypothetical protein
MVITRRRICCEIGARQSAVSTSLRRSRNAWVGSARRLVPTTSAAQRRPIVNDATRATCRVLFDDTERNAILGNPQGPKPFTAEARQQWLPGTRGTDTLRLNDRAAGTSIRPG